MKFIEKFEGSGSIKHHILPRSLFPDFKNLKEHEWNQSNLSHRAHFVSHWLLAKAFPKQAAMWKAFYAMANKDKQKINSKTYSLLREKHSKWNSETKKGNKEMSKSMSENRKNGVIPTWNKGVTGYSNNVSEEGRKRIKETASQKPSAITKIKMSKSMSSLPKCSCCKCKKEMAAHHLNRHVSGSKCIS